VVTPDGFAAGLRGAARQHRRQQDTADVPEQIEQQYGKARRVWVMDRGVPTEAVLAEMRNSDPPVQYLVGSRRTPEPAGEAPAGKTLAGRARGREGQAVGRGRRALRLRAK